MTDNSEGAKRWKLAAVGRVRAAIGDDRDRYLGGGYPPIKPFADRVAPQAVRFRDIIS